MCVNRYSSNNFHKTADDKNSIKIDNQNVTFQEQTGGLEKSKSDSKINQVSFCIQNTFSLKNVF